MRPLASRAPTLTIPIVEKRAAARGEALGLARRGKQKSERRQAAEPRAGGDQVHQVGCKMELSSRTGCRPGMADKGDERD
jgi:hypothetical protein